MSLDVEQRVRDRAYAIWLEEGCPDGRDADHWFHAERAVLAETAPIADIAPVVAVVKAPRKTTNAKPRTVVKTAVAEPAPAAPPKASKPRTRKTVIA
ncbi:DUF2934 domain-containing protein [Azospirillum endophyticum]|nr:DUF2934 domain-containing protein [Azospirillum endophyticum]